MLLLRVLVPVTGSLALAVILTPLVIFLVTLNVYWFGHLLQRHRRSHCRFECHCRTEYQQKLEELFQKHPPRRQNHRSTAPQHAEGTHQQHTASHHHRHHSCQLRVAFSTN
ncbi:hypothetical protein TcCL_NonESM13070 [Trypanosoma cruzi]|nr:hypothetical protein TcCL_NonESM13070 [Trypanosoma cruzi]